MSTPIRSLTHEKDDFGELLAADGSLLLRIGKDAIWRLRQVIYQGVRAIPQQPGLEIGGLCIASKPMMLGATYTVLNFVPVDIQYEYGPRFRASPADRAVFQQAMAKYLGDGISHVVGCFRSHLAADLQIRKEDQWLMNVLLGGRGGFLMLVQPTFDEVSVFSFGAGGIPLDTLPVARFSLRDGGPEEKLNLIELPAGDADLPFASSPVPDEATPEAPDEAASIKSASITGGLRGELAAFPASGSVLESPPPQTASTPKTPLYSTKKVWLVSLALLSLALVFLIFGARTPSAGFPTGSPIANNAGLAITNKGSSVQITWNASSPIVKTAVRGTLFATDDLKSSQVNLTAEQVHAGHYEFPRAAGDLFCEITLYQPDNSFVGETKTIRLRAGNGPAPATPALHEQPAPAFAAPPKRAPDNHTVSVADALASKSPPDNHARSAPDALSAKPAPDAHADSVADADPDAGETFVVKSARAPFVPPPSKEAVRGPVITSPPDVQGNPPPVNAMLPPVTIAVKPPVPPATPPVTPAVTSPVTTPVTPPARTAAPVAQSVTYSAAVPVKRVAPMVPPGARSLFHETVVVTVVVDIDARGKVTAARLSGDNKGIRQLLAPNCVQAAKLWQFQPGLRNGVPVASQTELAFRFTNP